MFKPYLIHKGKRYGFHNSIKTIFGVFPASIYCLLKGLVIVALTPLTCIIIGLLPDSMIVTLIESLIFIAGFLSSFYFWICPCRCSCVYCSASKEEVEQFIVKASVKNPYFKAQITDVQFDDGWYMIFYKSSKEVSKSENDLIQTYTIPVPKKKKKLYSKAFCFLMASLPFLFELFSSFLKLSEFSWVLHDVLLGCSVVPFIIWALAGIDFTKQCKKELLKKENFPPDQFIINSRYDKATNQLIFTIPILPSASNNNKINVENTESEFELNINDLIEKYRPRLVDNCKLKYSVATDGWLASIGGIFGDISGSRYEFSSIDRSEITFENAVSKYSRVTDDSILLLATLSVTNPPSEASYAEAYRKFYNQYPSVGYGPGFVRWALDESVGPYGSFGNGSAMRVAPIGEIYDDVEDVILHAINSAACTHNHPEGIKGAVVTAVCIWMSRYGYSKNDILSYVKKHYATQNLIKEYKMDEVRSCIQGGYAVTCQFSVPAAITCFIESDSYEDCIVNALSFEGDSDTIACIAGSIAAAFYGDLSDYVKGIVFDRVPKELRYLLNVS